MVIEEKNTMHVCCLYLEQIRELSVCYPNSHDDGYGYGTAQGRGDYYGTGDDNYQYFLNENGDKDGNGWGYGRGDLISMIKYDF